MQEKQTMFLTCLISVVVSATVLYSLIFSFFSLSNRDQFWVFYLKNKGKENPVWFMKCVVHSFCIRCQVCERLSP